MTTNTIQPPVSATIVHSSPLESIRAASEYIANHNTSLSFQIEETYKAIEQSKSQTAAAGLACTAATEAAAALTRDIDFLKKQLAEKQQEKENLEATIQLLELELHDNDMAIRQKSSLYKDFPKNAPSEVLQLRIDGIKLIATSQSKVNFPSDLILAINDAKQHGAIVAGKAICFLFIRKEDWTAVAHNKWSCDWNAKLKDLKAGAYLVYFCHLSVDEYDCKLSFPAQKLIIR